MFKEKLQGFFEIRNSFLNGIALTCDIEFRAKRNIDTLFAFNYGGKLTHLVHTQKYARLCGEANSQALDTWNS